MTKAHEQKQNDTFHFTVKVTSNKRNNVDYKVKVNLSNNEDYSTAIDRLKEIIRITYPSLNFKKAVILNYSE